MSNEDYIQKENNINRRIQRRQIARKYRGKKIFLDRIRVNIKFFFLIGLILFSYKFMTWKAWYYEPNVFSSANKNNLTIMGNVIAPTYKIMNALRQTDVPDTPLYLINPDKMEQNIKQIPTVKRVFIRRFFHPARFLIYIEEKQPILLISPAEKVEPVAAFLDDGAIIGREYMPIKDKSKTYLVLSYGTQGDDYKHWDAKKVNSIYIFAKSVEAYLKEDIEYIDCRNPKDIYVKFPTTSLRIGEIDQSIYSRIKNVDKIFQEIRTLHKSIKYIDCRWSTKYLKQGSNRQEETVTTPTSRVITKAAQNKTEKPIQQGNQDSQASANISDEN